MAYISFQPTDFFNPILYSGTAGTQTISGAGFQPDMTWLKARSESADWGQFDAVRGATKDLSSNNSNTESTLSDSLTSWNSDGFVMGSGADFNATSQTYVSYNWKAGTTSGLSGGTITPTAYSFNTTSGVSIVQYDGNSTSGATVPHGLGVAPKMVIIKCLDAAETWAVGHDSLGWTKYLRLDTTNAATTTSVIFNDTAPTSTLVTLGNNSIVNTHTTNGYIMYAFADVKGYSQFGSYEGNSNTDGPFIYTGFRPNMVILKNIDRVEAWNCFGAKRNPSNLADNPINLNDAAAEITSTSKSLDILSNGFKIRGTSTEINHSTMIYAAFAEFPLVSSNSKAGTAR